MNIRYFWLLLLLTNVCICAAQQYQLRVRHITVEDGLPNSVVNKITQDRDGFIWIGTNYGYCRYDGNNIEVHYQQFYSKVSAARHNFVRDIFQDKAGKLWINYLSINAWIPDESRIIELLDPDSKKVLSFDQYFHNQAPFKMAEIFDLIPCQDGTIWIITTAGIIYKYDANFKKIANIIKKTPPTSLEAFVKIVGNEKYLNIISENIIYEVHETGFYSVTTLPIVKIEELDWCWMDQENALWIFFYEKPEFIKKSQGEAAKRYPLSENAALRTFLKNNYTPTVGLRDAANRMWLFKNNRLFVFNENNEQIASAYINVNMIFTSHSVYFDTLNQLWISTGKGAYVVSLHKIPFHNYLTIEKGDIRGILVDTDNTVYINQQGIFEIRDKTKLLVNTPLVLTGILKEENVIWTGTYDAMLSRTDLNTHLTSFIKVDSSLYQNKHIGLNTLYKSKKTGRIWVGGYLFLGYLNKEKNKLETFTKYNEYKDLGNHYITHFYENEEGIWICTDQGIYLLQEDKGIVAHFGKNFPYQNIMHLYEDQEGIFWLATRGGGLLRWDHKNNNIQQFSQKNGLSNDVIYAVYEDDYNYLWLPSNYGLMRFNKTTHEARNYLPKDGLPLHEFNYLSHTRAPDGRLFFGGLGGVISFHPKDFLENKASKAPLRIINFKKLNTINGTLEDYTQDLLTTQRIILHPSERSIFMEVALLNYQNSKQNRYVYRIEGLEKSWKYIAGNSFNIGGLPYGNYTLHLKAQDVNGIWAKQELFIPIRVLYPFYLQAWFIISIFLISCALIYISIRLRTKHLIKEKQILEIEVAKRTTMIERQTKELQVLNEQKSRFFLNIAHDLRTPLSFITTPIELLLEDGGLDQRVRKLLQSIQRNTNHLLSLVEGILDLSRLSSRPLQLEEKTVDFTSLIGLIFATYDSYARMHHLKYKLYYSAKEPLYIKLDEKKFKKIIHNLLANALKYNVINGTVCLSVKETIHTISIEVKDTGIGIHPDDLPHIFEHYYQSRQENARIQGGSGIGLAIVQEYSMLMNGALQVQSEVGKGTTFTFTFPKKEVVTSTEVKELENIPSALSIAQDKDISPLHSLNNHKFSVLLVEDNVEMQQLLHQIISPYYNVIQAEHGEAAIKILSQTPVDCILTDVMMPQMDGFELIERLKKKPIWQQIPIIVITARANEYDKMKALRMGIDDYIYKPFSPKEVLVRLQNLIANYKSRQKYQRLEDLPQEAFPSADEQWLYQLEHNILEILNKNPDFNLSELASEMNLSERHFRRKLQELTGMTAKDYLREIRLQKARNLLEQKARNTIAEISYLVGFSSVNYFSKIFTERFGKKPSEYLYT